MVDSHDSTSLLTQAPSPRTLKGRYQVFGRIGVGGMAEVYKGRDTVLNREVAIKIMLSQYASDPSFAQRFKTEAQAAAQLRSPYAVPVYDYGEDGGQHFIVMDLVQGANLKKVLVENDTIPVKTVARFAWQICNALKKAHSMGIIHRDIKSSNIMITHDDSGFSAQIMDFGIAQAAHLNNGTNDEGMILGTAHYMSPEQASGGTVTASTDIYSLGIVMYEAVVGRLPFICEDVDRIIWKQINQEPIPPQHLNPAIDDDFDGIILKALKKKPEDRYKSTSEMLAALEAYISKPSHPHRAIKYPQFWAIGFVQAPKSLIGTVKRIDRPCVVGRSENSDIIVPVSSVSREHLKLTPRGLYLEAKDLKSSNGTTLNGDPIARPALCSAGDTLVLGQVVIRVGKSSETLR